MYLSHLSRRHSWPWQGLGCPTPPFIVENWTQTFYAAPVDFGGGMFGSQPQKKGALDAHPDVH